MNSLSPFKALLKRLMSENSGSASGIGESSLTRSDFENRHICLIAGHGEGKTTGIIVPVQRATTTNRMNDPEFRKRLAEKMKAASSSHTSAPHPSSGTENPEALRAILAEPNHSIVDITDPDTMECVQNLSGTKVI